MRGATLRLLVGSWIAALCFGPEAAFPEIDSGRGAASDGGAGASRESFKTDLFSGSLTASIPILVPAGTAGTQPSLALTYHGRSGLTWLGRGWDVSIPSLQRMTRFGIPKYDDDPDTGDYFSLGADRLVRDDSGTYRTMRDSFDRVERVEDGQGKILHWILHGKDGNTHTFGDTAATRIDDPSSGLPFEWLLHRTVDPNGNFIDYEYHTTGDAGADRIAYLKTISYSFRGDVSGSNTMRTVDFTIGARPDVSLRFNAGFRQRLGNRLEQIVVQKGSDQVARYEIIYHDEDGSAPPNSRSLVKKIVQHGATGGTSLPADVYTYSDSQSRSWTRDAGTEAQLSALDLTTGIWRFIEVNGDGVPDLVGTAYDFSGFAVYLNGKGAGASRFLPANTNVAFKPPFPLQGPRFILAPPPHPQWPRNFRAHWVDYNGDGRTDAISAVEWANTGGLTKHIYRNDGRNWVQEPGGYQNVPAATRVWRGCVISPTETKQTLIGTSELVDLNGDGLPEFLEHGDPDNVSCEYPREPEDWTIRNVYLNTGDGWEATPDAAWSAALGQVLDTFNTPFFSNLRFFDANGDGLPDVGVDADRNGVIDGTQLLLHTGAGWASDADFTFPADLRPADLNGDGFVDHLDASAQLNQGASFVAAGFAIPTAFQSASAGQALVDINGDGELDLVLADGTNTEVHLSGASPPDDLITDVDQGLGGSFDITYESTGEANCWDALNGGCHGTFEPVSEPPPCYFPYTEDPEDPQSCLHIREDLPLVLQTMRAITSNDANGNVAVNGAVYGLAHFDAAEREFRGFGLAIERPQTLAYTDPSDATNTVDLGVIRGTLFYRLAFMRGLVAVTRLYKSADDQLDAATDTLLVAGAPIYAVTRGDASAGPDEGRTLLVYPGAEVLECDPTLDEVLDPSGSSTCDFDALEGSAYEAVLAGPYVAFHSDFEDPTNRDRSSAYLVLEVGSESLEKNGQTAITRGDTLWYDEHGNVSIDWDEGEHDDFTDDRVTQFEFAEPNGTGPQNLVTRVARITEMEIPAETWEPGEIPELTEVTDQQFLYDGLAPGAVGKGNLTSLLEDWRDPVNNPEATLTVTTTWSYASGTFGLPTSVSEPRVSGGPTRVTSFAYDASQTFVASRARGDLTWLTTYDPPGAPRGLGIEYQRTDPNQQVTTFGADAFGRPTSRSSPVGEWLMIAYDDSAGFETHKLQDGAGNDVVVRRYMDGFGRVIQTERNGLEGPGEVPKTIVSETRYDVQGRVAFQSRPQFGTATGAPGVATFYDERGRLRFQVFPDGGFAERGYEGLTVTHTDPENRQRDEIFNGAGDLVAVVEHDGTPATTQYLYDDLGRLVRVCDALASSCSIVSADTRHSVEFVYDTLGRRVRIADPDRGTWDYSFDPAGRPLSQTDARAATIGFQYDDTYGRLTGENLEGDVTPEVTYTYGDELDPAPANGLGRLVHATDVEGTLDYTYDPAGRLDTLTANFGGNGPWVVDHGYDRLDRATSTQYPDDELVTRTYDLMGLDSITSPARSYVSNIDHNAEGRFERVDLGNGTYTTYGYAASTGYLERLRGNAPDGSPRIGVDYSYNLTGQLESAIDAIDSSESLTNAVYDGLGRLDSVMRDGQVLDYDHDAIGNLTLKEGQTLPYQHLTKRHAVWDANNPTRFEYDPNGNLTTREHQTLTYDVRNRLVAVADESLPISFGYDYAGRRIRAEHGADRSYFLGRDYEIKNGNRFVKTIRAGDLVVARVSLQPGASGQAGPRFWGLPIDPAAGLLATAMLVLVASGASLAARQTQAPAWRRALAGGLGGVFVASTTLVLTAQAAEKGDVRIDGSLDVADAVLAARELREPGSLDLEQSEAADVAPLWHGEATGDGFIDVADVLLLLRAVKGDDIDGDGLDTRREEALGTSAFSRDTDRDGLDDDFEEAYGSDPLDPDSDGDGFVDGKDDDPLSPAGDLVYWIQTDHLGGSAAVTEASGELVRRIRYGIWGEVRDNLEVVPAIASDPAEKFTGQRLDDFTGLLYYGARYYDPTLGRFTQPDSMIPDLTDPQAWNSYAYVLNDPLNRIDPTGNFSLSSVTGLFSSLFSPIGSAFQQTFHSTVSFVQSYVVAPLQTAWSSVKHFAGLAQTLVTSAFRMSSSPSQNATNAAQVARGQSQSSAAAATSGTTAAANSGSSRSYWNPLTWVKALGRDVLSIVRGVAIGGPVGIVEGLYGIGKGIASLSGREIGSSFLSMITSPIRYGGFGGKGWGSASLFGGGTPTSWLDGLYRGHDQGFGRGEFRQANADLTGSVWSRHDLGPYGQVHRGLSWSYFKVENAVIRR